MKKISQHISRFFTQPQPVQTLAAFRIAIGVFALVQLLVLLPDWTWIYGPHGLIPWDISDALCTRQTPGLSRLAHLVTPLGLTATHTLALVTGLYFLSLLGLITGFKSQLMGGVAWLMHLMLNTTGHFTAYGVETFAHIGLFYCMVLPVGICWSVDAYLKRPTTAAYLVTLSIRIIQLHLCIMYLASGLEKAMGTQWWNGNAIWIALQQDQFHHFNINWMAQVPLVPKLVCMGTLAAETLYPIGMLYTRSKRFWLPAILMMHFFIALFLGLQLFGGLMFVLNLSVFGEHCFPGLFTKRLRLFRFRSFFRLAY